MAQQTINVGSSPDDGTGDPARVAFTKCNANFTELYTADTAFLTTTVAATTYQPLDADLTAIAALTGTNTIYYRSGTSAWTAVTIGTGLTFTSGTLAASGGSAVASVPHEGQLMYVSATALAFKPMKGNQIKINGSVMTIPDAGIAGLGNTGVRVSNVYGSSLAANTTYWVFAENVSGTITGHFWTVAGGLSAPHHRPSQTAGNEGVEAWYNGTELPHFTLIGICRTNASSQFVDSAAQRLVVSWFNRKRRQLKGSSTVVTNYSTAAFAEAITAARVEWVNFVDEPAFVSWSGTVAHGTAGNWWNSGIGLDSATVSTAPETITFTITASYRASFSTSFTELPAEGYHFASALYAAAVVGSGATWFAPNNTGTQCLSGSVG